MFRRGKLSFLTTKDDRIKVINDRINLTEKHLIDLCSAISTCTRKQAKCRDSYDDLAKSFKSYADDENVNESLSAGLKNFTNAVTVLADYMDLEVHRTEIKIINELAQFETVCKTVRENLRTAVIARDKEVLRQKQMIEIKTKFSANTSAADSELLKAKLEVNRTNKDIDEIINNFEQRKLGDLKAILENFVLIQMKYHTKALEALSAIYYDAASIDEKYDFREFQKLLRDKETAGQRKLGMKKEMHSQSMESLDRDQLLSPSRRLSRISKSSKNLAEETDGDDDAENDDGYDEHSEYDDSDNPSQDPSETDSEVAESTSRLEEKKKSLSKQKSIQPHMNSINDSGKSMKNPLGIPLGKENSGIRSSNPRSRTGNLVTIVKSKKHIDYTSDDSDDNKEYNSNRMLIQKQIHK